MSKTDNTPQLIPTPKRQERARSRERRRRLLVGAAVGTVALLAMLVLGFFALLRPASPAGRSVEIKVPSGIGVTGVGALLEKKGVVRSGFAFALYARLTGEGSRLKSGTYRLAGSMTAAAIIEELKTGGAKSSDGLIRVTIPEGFTLKQIGQALEDQGVLKAKTFEKYAADPYTIAHLQTDFPKPRRTLEGYLFPDTYAFKPQAAPGHVLEAMLLNFSERFYRPYQQEIANSGIPLHDLVTTASLVEREAKVPGDRPLIAGVLDNRLKRNMKLEVDATVLYALGRHKDHVYYKDLAVRSPYNTYRVHGLPPGPIANPGLASLMAALRPEQSDYLFYVARSDGSHAFSRTLAEHEAAKKQARIEREQQERNGEVHPGG